MYYTLIKTPMVIGHVTGLSEILIECTWSIGQGELTHFYSFVRSISFAIMFLSFFTVQFA